MSGGAKQIDDYIARSGEFARPILKKLRAAFHKACPDIEETLKWNTPAFLSRGLVAGMAAFQRHVRLSFWKGALLSDPAGLLQRMGETSLGAISIGDVSQLPPQKVLIAYIQEAVELNKQDVKPVRPKSKRKRKPVEVPADLAAALKKNKPACETFEGFSPSHRREYVEWISEAKRPETRRKRVETAVEWMAEGKPRNWKYLPGR